MELFLVLEFGPLSAMLFNGELDKNTDGLVSVGSLRSGEYKFGSRVNAGVFPAAICRFHM